MIVGLAYGKPAMIVDTHMIRVSGRIGLTAQKDPEKIEKDLEALVPGGRPDGLFAPHDPARQVYLQGKKPDCPRCLLRDDCDYLARREERNRSYRTCKTY